MENKQKLILDRSIQVLNDIGMENVHFSSRPRGYVSAYVHGTNVPLFTKKPNKVIVDGSMFTAMKYFNMLPVVNLKDYNTAIGLDNIDPLTSTEQLNTSVVLFCMGLDGCGPEQSQVYDVNYTKWISPENLVPFRFELADHDLSDADREIYFGRKEVPALNRIAYYFKAFDTTPVMYAQYVDGTPIDENIYISENTNEVEVYVEMKMSITKEDCRDYFVATSGIKDAKVSSISLLAGYPKTYNGKTYYQGVRPITKYNFSSEPLSDLTKGIDIVYDLYY